MSLEGNQNANGNSNDGGQPTLPNEQPVTRTPAVLNDPRQQKTFTVGGRQLSEEELFSYAQKGFDSDQRVAELQRKLEEAGTSAKGWDIIQQMVETGDQSLFPRFAAELGLSGDEIREAQAAFEASLGGRGNRAPQYSWDEDEDDEEDDAPRNRRDRQEDGPIGYERFSPDVQRILLQAEKGRIAEIVKKGLDKDDVIGYYMQVSDGPRREAVQRMVDREIKHWLAANKDFGDGGDALKEVLPVVREYVEHLALPPTVGMGEFGSAPATIGDLPRTPSKAPDYIPATDPRFEQYISDSIRHNLREANSSR